MTSNTARSALTVSIALFLLASLLLATTANPAAAAWDGTTTAEPPLAGEWYEIGTPEQLAGFRDWVNDGRSADPKYKLAGHIDLGGEVWTPIGNSTGKEFKGVFDGNGFTIGNFKLRYAAGRASYGLFGNVKGTDARIENLGIVSFDVHIENAAISALKVGALAGHVTSGTIENCFAVGNVAASAAQGFNIGGLIGHTTGTTKNVAFSGGVSADLKSASAALAIGGIAGAVEGALSSSYAHGTVRATSISTNFGASVGGLVGETNQGSVTDSHSTITIEYNGSGLSYVGGIVGQHVKGVKSGFITTSYANGSVIGGTQQGGIAGRNRIDGGVKGCYFLYRKGLEKGIGLHDTGINPGSALSLDAEDFSNQTIFENQEWNFGGIWTYTALDHGERPRLRAFLVDEGVIKPDFIVFNPPELTIRENQAARVTVAIPGFTIDGPLSFDNVAAFYGKGITVSDEASNGTFVISADTEVVGTTLNVGIGIPVDDTVQKKTYRIRTEGDFRITTTALPDGFEGKDYRASMLTANANGAVSFSVTEGLPEGVSLDRATGQFFGTPTQSGVFSFVVAASDDRQIASRTLTLAIAKKTEEAGGTGGGEEQPNQPDQPGQNGQLAIDALLAPLNMALSGGASFVLGNVPADVGKPITTIAPGAAFLPARATDRIFANGKYTAVADSFSIQLPIASTNGDLLALSYTVNFANHTTLDELEARLAVAYEHEDGSLTFLIGDGGIASWRTAIAGGAAVLSEDDLTVRYAVRDAAGSPSFRGSVITIPDGVNDATIADPIWLLQKRASVEEPPKTPETPGAQPGGKDVDESPTAGSSGCASGAFAFGIFGAMLLPSYKNMKTRRGKNAR